MFGITNLLQGGENVSSIVMATCVLAGCVVVMLVMLSTAIRIVPEYRRLVIFRLGRYMSVVGPGIVILLPMIDRSIPVDLRSREQTVLAQEAVTQDGAKVNIDLFWSYKAIDPAKSVLNVKDLDSAAKEAMSGVLRAAFGEVDYGDILHDRSQLRTQVQERLQQVMQPWGCEVESLELREIRCA
ncbi:MAG: SPFH domain-containing protein [Chloroflexota bacterium]